MEFFQGTRVTAEENPEDYGTQPQYGYQQQQTQRPGQGQGYRGPSPNAAMYNRWLSGPGETPMTGGPSQPTPYPQDPYPGNLPPHHRNYPPVDHDQYTTPHQPRPANLDLGGQIPQGPLGAAAPRGPEYGDRGGPEYGGRVGSEYGARGASEYGGRGGPGPSQAPGQTPRGSEYGDRGGPGPSYGQGPTRGSEYGDRGGPGPPQGPTRPPSHGGHDPYNDQYARQPPIMQQPAPPVTGAVVRMARRQGWSRMLAYDVSALLMDSFLIPDISHFCCISKFQFTVSGTPFCVRPLDFVEENFRRHTYDAVSGIHLALMSCSLGR